eukprot:Protomagalhaensia_sp_Gyna_25__2363@NODE_2302_length_1163_cov_4_021352_g1907_i0_p1_GENE_NODE_2302_length_1163_cov_4_021352_g1907_i0NODE_2302_length_1163_cov_4_021352_g1907_i0_p1_ORF_typecomplete_len191_score24_34Thioredoxin/PF00085_20/9_6e02Thioredoxin/PF00085_20/2_4e14Thioredoxin_6/PF13848_6/0_14Thioredoxin_6/PF13848_6/0_0042Thioredoxin_7/PF13899_6/8_1e02Thioredoxin_7/PF13899_6/0_00059Redoxin/PF08534_10/5_3e02Redoxin/PF08534_10/0_00073Thioredoxin_8/PF13905_6/5_3e02Thioredoxin_8/PF13905_6/7_5e03T
MSIHSAESFGFSKYPAAALVDNEGRYLFDRDVFTEKSVEDFLQRFENGQIPKYLTSQPEPGEQGDVLIVSGASFKREVLRSDGKDVLMLFYAPYCGPCQKLMPAWEQLARALAPSSDILVAKYDHSANEIDVEGFYGRSLPSVFLVTRQADGQHLVTRFEGEQPDLESLLSFVYHYTNKKIMAAADVHCT